MNLQILIFKENLTFVLIAFYGFSFENQNTIKLRAVDRSTIQFFQIDKRKSM